jgi:hypothetical protein
LKTIVEHKNGLLADFQNLNAISGIKYPLGLPSHPLTKENTESVTPRINKQTGNFSL